ncbi:MAG: serine/threonine-protein kinase [Myxococcaceae bacterium]
MSLVGRHIGRYRILEQLGSGGMSVVYKGIDTELEREVAVKVLHAHLAQKEESRARLAREAKAVARLHHPNILEVYDFAGEDGEEAYLVTEYIRGQTLRQYADTVGFEPPEVAAMVIHEVAAALAQAHEAGIIHRDLKPENVMVRFDGVIKLMDFGIAKILDRDDRMTMTGALVGSPAHMAPEIIEGEEAGAEADVFSLGTMLYVLTTGRLPFTAPNTTATLKRILDGIYDDPRQLMATVSDDLAEIIATCLARQPSSRYPTAGKLRDALADHLGNVGLSRPSEELSSFFADPPSYRKLLIPRLSQALIAQCEALLAEKRPAKALAALNQVLAHDPAHPRALELLQQMNASRRKQRAPARWRKIGLGMGAAMVVVFGAGLAGWRALEADPAPLPAPKPVEPEPARPLKFEVKTAARSPEIVAARIEPSRTQPRSAGPEVRTATIAVPVSVHLRPYGYLQLEGREKTPELSRHELKLSPGTHRLTIGCGFCEPVEETLVVPSVGAPKSFFFSVRPRPASLVVEFHPSDAWVSVNGGQPRRVADTDTRPIEVALAVSPQGVEREVEYEVFLPGFKNLKQKVLLTPGQVTRVAGSLEAE